VTVHLSFLRPAQGSKRPVTLQYSSSGLIKVTPPLFLKQDLYSRYKAIPYSLKVYLFPETS